MYYWVKVIMAKRKSIIAEIVSGIQELLPSEDINDRFLSEASVIPAYSRNKEYTRELYKIINWRMIYTRELQNKTQITLVMYTQNNPFININQILDILTAHVFL